MKLISQIKEAFNSRKEPEDLFDSKQLTDTEKEEVLRFTNKDWNSINSDFLKKSFEVFNWFSTDAFLYFLPRICIAGIIDDERDLLLYDSLIQELDRSPVPEYWDDRFKSKYLKLTEKEINALQDWIFWLAEDETLFDDLTITRCLETLDLLKVEQNIQLNW